MSRKWLSSLIAIGFLLYGFNIISVRAASPLHSTSRMEAMLVVDVSNSMKGSDPNKISHEAMKMFIDMASLNGDKIGAIAYSDAVMREKALIKILTEEDKEDLKEFIDTIETYSYTDLSTGVMEAVKVLDTSHEQEYVPLIVLLADGNDELDPKKAKTLAEAQSDLKKAVAEAKAKGYPIYTIGLNADGTLNKDVLRNVAENTKGTFFEATSADQLPQILSEIFANHLKLKIVPVKQIVGNGDFEDIEITVPNDNVVEANISFISSQPVEVRLFDSSGKEHAIPSNQVRISRSRTYSLIKLVKPVQGDWTLKVKGVPQDQIDINLVFNYDLNLKLDPPSKQSFNTGEIVNIHAFFEDSGTAVTDEDIYQSMKARVYLKDLEKGKTEEFALHGGGDGFSGQIKLGASTDYEIIVKAEDQSFFRETAPQRIAVKQTAAAAADSAKPEIKEKKNKEASSFPWLYAAAGIAGMILLIGLASILFLMMKRARRGFSGQMAVEIKDEDTGERLSPQFKKLKLFKGKFQLHHLLALSPEFAETAGIVFKPAAGDSLLLINHSNCIIEKNSRAIDAKKGIIIKRNDRLRIIPKKTNKSIYVEYIV